MQKFACFLIIAFILSGCSNNASDKGEEVKTTTQTKNVQYAMVIHGGAGTILKKNMTADREKAYQDILNEALDIGSTILSEGGSSQEAVVSTIKLMENSPLFNAGKGAVFTHDGTNKHDASIMDGKTLNAGAVGGIGIVKNPITAAVAVMEKSEHVFMVGKGAEEFAKSQNLELVDPKYFYTEGRWKSLQKALEKDKLKDVGNVDILPVDYKYGTVGVVALDKNGDIVAGTSTGGMTNKKFDRIGDSPVIGAGTYANNNTCGVSCTGHGEYFIRYAVAYDVSAMMEYGGHSLDEAAQAIVNEKLKEAGGSGGLIALDKYGNVSMPFNTPGMYRGYVNDKERYIGIYEE